MSYHFLYAMLGFSLINAPGFLILYLCQCNELDAFEYIILALTISNLFAPLFIAYINLIGLSITQENLITSFSILIAAVLLIVLRKGKLALKRCEEKHIHALASLIVLIGFSNRVMNEIIAPVFPLAGDTPLHIALSYLLATKQQIFTTWEPYYSGPINYQIGFHALVAAYAQFYGKSPLEITRITRIIWLYLSLLFLLQYYLLSKRILKRNAAVLLSTGIASLVAAPDLLEQLMGAMSSMPSFLALATILTLPNLKKCVKEPLLAICIAQCFFANYLIFTLILLPAIPLLSLKSRVSILREVNFQKIMLMTIALLLPWSIKVLPNILNLGLLQVVKRSNNYLFTADGGITGIPPRGIQALKFLIQTQMAWNYHIFTAMHFIGIVFAATDSDRRYLAYWPLFYTLLAPLGFHLPRVVTLVQMAAPILSGLALAAYFNFVDKLENIRVIKLSKVITLLLFISFSLHLGNLTLMNLYEMHTDYPLKVASIQQKVYEGFKWLHDNTPPDKLIFTTYGRYDRFLPVFTGRRIYNEDLYYIPPTENLTRHEMLIKERDAWKIYANMTTHESWSKLVKNSVIYIITYRHDKQYKELETYNEMYELVFENKFVRIYKINEGSSK